MQKDFWMVKMLKQFLQEPNLIYFYLVQMNAVAQFYFIFYTQLIFITLSFLQLVF